MKAIVAVDNNWGIGKDNSLLVHLPRDLQFFKDKTYGKVIVMGRQTLESFPGGKPLPGRTNIVLTSNEDYPAPCEICCSSDELFRCISGYDEEDVFIVGGEQIYREFISDCNLIYVTKINAIFPADRYFPNLDKNPQWELVYEGEPIEENEMVFKFCEYRRREF